MIFLDSRYVDGSLVKVWNAKKQQYDLSVLRTWPEYAQSFFIYEWVDGDRLDLLATRFLGNPSFWWQLLDLNPEILDPLTIAPGTQLRIPNA